MPFEIIKADYENTQHQNDIFMLLNSYASEVVGGGKPLDDFVKTHLAEELAKRPYAFSVLAYDGQQAVGLINCFEAFSTFSCKPLVNIHDVAVLEAWRGKGISQLMLKKVEDIAREKGCCKLTLEVLSQNEPAKRAYIKYGFSDYMLDPETGSALFWQKSIKNP